MLLPSHNSWQSIEVYRKSHEMSSNQTGISLEERLAVSVLIASKKCLPSQGSSAITHTNQLIALRTDNIKAINGCTAVSSVRLCM